MRICLISADYPLEPGWGGIGTYTRALAHGLARRGHEVHVLTGVSTTGQQRLMDGDVHVHRVATQSWPLPGILRRKGAGIWAMAERALSVSRYLLRLHRTARFDIVEAPNWGGEALVYSLRRAAPLLVRVSTPFATVQRFAGRNDRPRLGLRLHRWLEALPVRRARRVIANSRFTTAIIRNEYGVAPERITVVPHGIELAAQTNVPEDRSSSPVVLYVGRLERRKGTRHLLEAIPAVVAACPDARFRLVGKDGGDAPGATSYQAYFASFAWPAAQAATTFVGYVDQDQLEQEYRSCDIFVAPSLFESFGLIHLEAMARGKPVVAFDTAATPEIVVHGETGLLASVEDSAALGQALVRLLEQPEQARLMGQRGLERARTVFSLEQMVDRTLAVYDAVVQSAQK